MSARKWSSMVVVVTTLALGALAVQRGQLNK